MSTATLTPLQEALEARAAVIAEGQALAKIVEDGGSLDADQRKALRSSIEQKEKLDVEVAELQGDAAAVDVFREAAMREKEDAERRRASARPASYTAADAVAGAQRGEARSLGETFTDSDVFEDLIKRYPRGGSDDVAIASDALTIPTMRHFLGMFTKAERARMRALINTTSPTVAGAFVEPLVMGLVEPGQIRPLTLRDQVTVIPISTDSFSYVQETTRAPGTAYTTQARNVAQASALSGTTGTKPEGGIAWSKGTGAVKTIAEWIPVTRQGLSDVPQMRGYIDAFLVDDLGLRLDDQMLNGDGTGENLTGILQTSGIQTFAATTTYAQEFDAIRHAITLIRTNGRTMRPLTVLANPADAEQLDVMKAGAGAAADNGGPYYGGGPYAAPANVGPWRTSLVESEAMPADTVLVGDFSKAVLLDREDTSISVGTVNDDFIRNIVRVLAEMRAGFFVQRPKAFCTITSF